MLEDFLVLEHDIAHNNFHNPKSWVEDYDASLVHALTWFHMHAERTRDNYLHLHLLEDLQERAQHLHYVVDKKKWMRKIMRAWYTLIEDGIHEKDEYDDDHYDLRDEIEDRVKIEVRREDLESQKSEIPAR